MDYLRADGLGLQAGQRDVLKSVSLTLRRGERVGLVGRNGAGKTTLLRILAGDLKPTEGTLNRSPGVRLAYVRQTPLEGEGTLLETAQTALTHVRGLEGRLRDEEKRLATGEGSLEHYGNLITAFEQAGGYRAERELEALLFDLGFTAAQFDQPLGTLSGGERARLKLGVALARTPDVLLLDEPSNHLDLKLKRKLAARLAAFPNALLMASHDRALLDAVCTHVGALEKGHLHLHKGGYAQFRARQVHMQHKSLKQSKQRAKEIARLQAAQARLKTWGTPKAQRQRRQLVRRLENLEPEHAESPERNTGPLTLQPKRVRGVLFKARHLSKAYSGRAVVDDVSFTLAAGDKVALVGPNGSGKSTLLELVSGAAESEHPEADFHWHASAKLAVFDQQERGVSALEPPLAQLERHVSRPRAEQLLALVGVPQPLWGDLPVAVSGGERARLGLALLIASEANVLLLDEPTNDLDIATIETLETTLRDAPAAVLFTSHDEQLIEKVATRVWSLEAGKLLEYRGGVEGYFGSRVRSERVEGSLEAAPTAPEVSLEALELERVRLEDRLLDPLLCTERELARLKASYAEVLNELSHRYDAGLPEPLPRYSCAVSGVSVSTDGFERDGSVAVFETPAGWRITLVRPQKSGVGHLSVVESGAVCSLAWARRSALAAVTRLAFERLDVSALQLQTEDELSSLGFSSAGENWWILSLSSYEKRLGYPPPTRRKSRKKRREKRKGDRSGSSA